MEPIRIDVTAAAGAYPVLIGAGLLDTLRDRMDRAGLGPRRVLISSPTVWDLHHPQLRTLGTEPKPVLVPDGERSKTVQTVGIVYEALIKMHADRSTVIIAAGGGVIGDLVGFAAATFLRGVRVVQVPTTLLAQVDAAIGGKTGVNHPLGKNLIGAFHPPALVAADTSVLATLARREFRAGLYEVVKYGVIASAALFDRVRDTTPALFAHDRNALDAVVSASCRIKAQIVSSDERESGLRRILNFGHTVGHALEAVTKYRRFLHGEAIAYGMLAASALGAARGVTPAQANDALRALIAQLGPLPAVSDLSAREVIAAIGHDKKVIAGTLHFVAATGIGSTTILSDVTEKELKTALKGLGLKS
jgi:3-dehydroquinate synthase